MQKKFGKLSTSFLEGDPIFELKILETIKIVERKLEDQIKQKIKSIDIDELANEYIEYLKRKTGSAEASTLYRKYSLYLNEFLSEKEVPNDYEIRRALRETGRDLLREEVELEQEKREKEQVKKEKELVPQLVTEIIEWAKANGLKRIRKTDVEAFLLEKNLENLHYLTKDSIWKLANAKLKRQK